MYESVSMTGKDYRICERWFQNAPQDVRGGSPKMAWRMRAEALEERGLRGACLSQAAPRVIKTYSWFDSLRYKMCRQASSEATSSRVCCTAGWAGRAPVACMPEWALASW